MQTFGATRTVLKIFLQDHVSSWMSFQDLRKIGRTNVWLISFVGLSLQRKHASARGNNRVLVAATNGAGRQGSSQIGAPAKMSSSESAMWTVPITRFDIRVRLVEGTNYISFSTQTTNIFKRPIPPWPHPTFPVKNKSAPSPKIF